MSSTYECLTNCGFRSDLELYSCQPPHHSHLDIDSDSNDEDLSQIFILVFFLSNLGVFCFKHYLVVVSKLL
jgi:hypothetical protein